MRSLHSRISFREILLTVMFFSFASYGQTAQFPFQEKFNSDSFSSCWQTYSSTPRGSVRLARPTIEKDSLVHMGDWGRVLYRDSMYVGNALNLNEITLSIDLSSRRDVYLTAWFWGELLQTHASMPDSFENHGRYSGVAVSPDGDMWYRAKDLGTDVPDEAMTIVVDLDSLIARYGIDYTSSFKVRIQQFGTKAQASYWGHFYCDDIHVHSPAQKQVNFSTSGDGVVENETRPDFLPGVSFPIKAHPNAGSGFSRWVVSEGDAHIKEPFNRSTVCSTFTDATIEAVFEKGATVHVVDTADLPFSGITHAFAGYESNEIRFKCANNGDSLMGVCIFSDRGANDVSVICYGSDSTFQNPVKIDTTCFSGRVIIPLENSLEGDSCYFSVFLESPRLRMEPATIRLCRLYKTTFEAVGPGVFEDSVVYSMSRDWINGVALPDSGYYLKEWKLVSGASVIEDQSNLHVRLRIGSDTHIIADFEKDSVYDVDTSSETIIPSKQPPTQRNLKIRISVPDTGKYIIRFEWMKGSRPAEYTLYDTDSTFTNTGEQYYSQNGVVYVSMHHSHPARSSYMSVDSYNYRNTSALKVSITSLHTCSTVVSGEGTVDPPVLKTAPDILQTIQATPRDSRTMFESWEIVSGECVLTDNHNPQLSFYNLGNTILKASFVKYPLTVLDTGASVMTTYSERAANGIQAVFEAPSEGGYIIRTNNCATLYFYGEDSSFTHGEDSLMSNRGGDISLEFEATHAGQKLFFWLYTNESTQDAGRVTCSLERNYRLRINNTLFGSAYHSATSKMEKRLYALADTNGSFSHWRIDSGTATLRNDTGEVTDITLFSDVTCTPVFKKVGPVKLHTGVKTITESNFYKGLAPEAPLRFQFTAPHSGWYTFTMNDHSASTNRREYSITCFGTDSTFTDSVLMPKMFVNQIVLLMDEDSTYYFEYSHEGNSPFKKLYTIEIERFHDVTFEASDGGRILQSGSHLFGYNDTFFVEARPNPGYTFRTWSITSGSAGIDDSLSPSSHIHVTSDAVIVAQFQKDTIWEIDDSADTEYTPFDELRFRYVAPQKGNYQIVLESEDFSGSAILHYVYTDSTFTTEATAKTIDSSRNTMRFFVAESGQNVYFRLKQATREKMRHPFTIKIMPLYSCIVSSPSRAYVRPDDIAYVAPGESCSLAVEHYYHDMRFVGWEIASGAGKIDSATSYKTRVYPESDMVIKTVFDTADVYTITEQEKIFPGTDFYIGNNYMPLVYTATEPGTYAVVIKNRAHRNLYYYGEQLFNGYPEGISFSDSTKMGFHVSSAGERHYFSLSNSTYLHSDTATIKVEKAWKCVFTPNPYGTLSVSDTSVVYKDQVLRVNATPYDGYDLSGVDVVEGEAEVNMTARGFSVSLMSDAVFKVRFEPLEHFCDTVRVGKNDPSFKTVSSVNRKNHMFTRFVFIAEETATYAMSSANANYYITDFGEDSTCSTEGEITYNLGENSIYHFFCKSGEKRYFEFANFDTYSRFPKPITLKKCNRMSVQSDSGGICYPSGTVYVAQDSIKTLSAVPKNGFFFKGWYAINGPDTARVSNHYILRIHCTSDTVLFAGFEKNTIHNLTNQDTVLETAPAAEFGSVPAGSLLFRFVAPDTGRYAFSVWNSSGQLYSPKSVFYGRDSSFSSVYSYHVEASSDRYTHPFRVNNAGDSYYFTFRNDPNRSRPMSFSVKKALVVRLSNRMEDSQATYDSVCVPLGTNYKPTITSRVPQGYRFEKWSVEKGGIEIADTLAPETEINATSDGEIVAHFSRGMIHPLTAAETAYRFADDFYERKNRIHHIRFSFSPPDTGLYSLSIPFNSGYLSLHSFGRDSSFILDAALKRVDLWHGNATWINFRATDTSRVHYFSVSGGASTHPEDFRIKVVRPCVLEIDTQNNGSATADDRYLPSGTLTTLRANPDSGYGFAGWNVLDGDVRFSDPRASRCTVTVYSDCRIEPRYRAGELYEVTSDDTRYSFVENSSIGPAGRYEVPFIYKPEKDEPFTFELVDDHINTNVYYSVRSSDSSESRERRVLRFLNEDLISGKQGVDYYLSLWSYVNTAGSFSIRVKGEMSTAVETSEAENRHLYGEGSLFVAPNPLPKEQALCNIYFKPPFPGDAELTIYDPLGNQLTSYTTTITRGDVREPFFQWDLRNRHGRRVGAGTYLVVVEIKRRGWDNRKYRCKVAVRE